MLKIISILTLIYFLSSTALADSNNNDDAYRGNNDSYKPLPLHLADAASRTYYEAGGKQVKPCSKLHDKVPSDVAGQELLPTPTYTARIIKTYPGNTNNFKPQSLKNVPVTEAVEEPSKHNHENKTADSDKLDEDNIQVKNANGYSDQSKSENKNVENKANSKELDNANNSSENSKLSSKEQGVLESETRNAYAENDKSDESNFEDKNTKSLEKGTEEYNKVEKTNNDKLSSENDHKSDDAQDDFLNEESHLTKNLHEHSKEIDEARSKYLNKYSTVAKYNGKVPNYDKEQLENSNYAKSDSDEQSEELQVNKDDYKGLYYNANKGLYYRPNKNKVNSHELSHTHYESDDDELSSEINRKGSRYSDEIEDTLYGVQRNRADSDELNDALYQIRKHLDHSEELINALKEVGRKGKTYSNVLNDALYKVKKHKAESEELNKSVSGRYGDESSESDSSEENYSVQQYERKTRPYLHEKYEKGNTLYKVKKHKAESEELNKSVSGRYGDESSKSDSNEEDYNAQQYEIKTGPYLREKYEKGNTLYKFKKHKAESEELNKSISGRYGDESSESDSSEEDYSAQKYETKTGPYLHEKYENGNNKQNQSLLKKNKYKNLPSKNGYSESDEQSRFEDSEAEDSEVKDSGDEDSHENSHKCPSNQVNLVVGQLYKNDATRRLLSESEDPKSALSESASSEAEAEKDGQNENKVGKLDLDKDDSKTAEDKGSEENKSYKSNATQKDAEPKNKAKADDSEDSQTAEEKEGEDDSENYNNNVNSPQGSAGYAVSQLGNSKAGYGYNLPNPAQGPGVSELSNGLNLFDHRTVCYACSSIFDSSCFSPNERATRVKYCRRGHDQCITKVTSIDDREVVIRDCGNTCIAGNLESVTIWNSCNVCAGDLCNDEIFEPNGAFSINSQSLMFTVFVMFAIKLTM